MNCIMITTLLLLGSTDDSLQWEDITDSVDSEIKDRLDSGIRDEARLLVEGEYLSAAEVDARQTRDLLLLKSWVDLHIEQEEQASDYYDSTSPRSHPRYDAMTLPDRKVLSHDDAYVRLRLASADDAGRFPADYFWTPELNYWTVRPGTQRLHADAEAQFKRWLKEQIRARSPIFQPVIADEKRMWFVMRWDQLRFWLSSRLHSVDTCPAVNLDSANHQHRELLRKIAFMKDTGMVPQDAVYDTVLIRDKAWGRRDPLYFDQLWQRMTTLEGRMALFLRPDMLEHGRLTGPTEIVAELAQPEPPRWVQERLSFNPAWIDAAKRRLEGLTWEQFLHTHGFILGDRSIRDMMFTYDLRASDEWAEYSRRQRVDCEPESGVLGYGPRGAYTQCAEDLWSEEREAELFDRLTTNALVDRYLKGDN